MSRDGVLDAVYAEVSSRAGDPIAAFPRLVRDAIDEVLEGPRTGRFDFFSLNPVEKTYVGIKVETLLRTRLDLTRGAKRDLIVQGESVDIKWSWKSQWMIPPESRGELVICIGGREKLTKLDVGIVRATRKTVQWSTKQRDKKGRLTQLGITRMRWMVRDASLPPNFVAALDPDVRDLAISEPTVQRRVAALFAALPYEPIPRNAIRTIARTEGDPLRRVRQDRHAGDPLAGLVIVSRADGGGKILAALDLAVPPKDHFVAIRREDLARVPHRIRKSLSVQARRRFGFE